MARNDKSQRTPWYYWLAPVAIALFVVCSVIAFHRVESFLIGDTRFHLPGPPDYGMDAPNLQVDGVKHASKADIQSVFERDFGRSLYLFPVAERRRNLLAVDWVKDATVSRQWPNHVAVKIDERTPVAFAQLAEPRGAGYRYALIDDEGVLLPSPGSGARFNLPVLVGIRLEENESQRRDRVRRMLYLMKEVGPLSEKISEVDVADVGNLTVTAQAEDRIVVLLLGSQRFRQRAENFFNHYPEIRRRLPDAKTFDLRLDDRITVVGGDRRGE
jgi:cell division protein FtsQ